MKKRLKNIIFAMSHMVVVSAILLEILLTQMSYAQNLKHQTNNNKNLTKASIKQVSVSGTNIGNYNNYPKVIALKQERPFEEVFLDWQRTSNNETYKKLIAENIKQRVQLLEQRNNPFNNQPIHDLNNIIEKVDYIKNEDLACKALIKIAQLEKYYLMEKLITEKKLLKYNSIKPTDTKNVPFSIESVNGKINWVKSSLYEKNGIGYYKEGSEPGSGLSRNTNISVTNNGTETTDYFVEVSDANRPVGWDMFWWKITLPHQSPTFKLNSGQTIDLVDANQSGTQSPSYETSDTWVYYDLYQDANWPFPNNWLSGVNKDNKNDVTTPVSSVNSLAPTQSSKTFQISWNVNDPGIGASGISSYFVWYRINTSGTWQVWQLSPSYHSANFTGEEGKTYYFAASAIDNVKHYEAEPIGNGNTQTYILKHYVITTSSNPSNGGTTTGTGDYTENGKATVSAIANSGWNFVDWTENGSNKSNTPGYTFDVTRDIHLVANFKISKPDAPTNLVASNVIAKQINLNWQDNATNEVGYKIERKIGGSWEVIKSLSANVKSYSDTGLSDSTDYYYRVFAYNGAGNSAYSNEAHATTLDVELISSAIPDHFFISQNFPNPFNPSTMIEFGLLEESNVSLKIFDITGQVAQTVLAQETLSAGTYQYNFIADQLPSGFYLYVINSNSTVSNKTFRSVKKMILLK